MSATIVLSRRRATEHSHSHWGTPESGRHGLTREHCKPGNSLLSGAQ